MKVLISGAGIAGLTVAYWLKRYGFTPTIVERAPALLTGGYKIDVRGTALQVLRRMGIYDAIVASGTNMQGALLVNKEGKIIHEMSGDEFGHRVGDDVEIIRGVLCQILMEQVPDVEFIFGDSVKNISPSSKGVQIDFQNNKSREFDLVIGADGLHSNVRRLAFGDETSFLHNLGLYLCVFTVPNYLNLDRIEMQYTELGKVAAVWSARGEPNMKACFGFAAPSTLIDLHNKAQQQQVLRTIYQGIGWEVPQFLQMMPDSPDFYFDTAAQIYMDHWSQGRVSLVGDAAYCASPMSGQGTSLALIGAYVLAGELAAAKGAYQTAFDQYEKQMRSLVKVNQELGIRAAKLMRSQEKSNLLAWLLKQLMQIVPGRLTKFFINRATRRINQAANFISLKDY
ncbi:oxidoreductase [Legionella lansingensis]|uniref:Oxidoreductase n=1 Tax=Legionella lansingensis TaxID=45067 RepID=A0A0W0VRU1_9GAMM|nr:FAD-dependent monooxygenase [Legionella lansingensis]KTD22767.1 oxidoreductase [Legionella lansingensis]SNV57059.1 oxidoreductase [Legionella lansingensis]